MFVCVQNPPAFRRFFRFFPDFPHTFRETPQVFVDRQHGHVGGDVLGCARRKFQLLRSKLVRSLCGAQVFHVETGKTSMFWCRIIDGTGSYNLQSEMFFWCFAWSTNVGESVEMGGQRFCLILTKESIQMVCSVTEWRSDLWTCKFSQVLPKMQMMFFQLWIMSLVIIIPFIFDQQAGRPNPKF